MRLNLQQFSVVFALCFICSTRSFRPSFKFPICRKHGEKRASFYMIDNGKDQQMQPRSSQFVDNAIKPQPTFINSLLISQALLLGTGVGVAALLSSIVSFPTIEFKLNDLVSAFELTLPLVG